MKTIILDTSFILTALKNKIDIVTQLTKLLDEKYCLKIIDKTFQELKDKPLESLAKTFISTYKIEHISTTQHTNVDNLILENLNPSTIVATQDKKLKEKLKKRKTAILTIRQQKYITLV